MMWLLCHLISWWGVGLNTSDLTQWSGLIGRIASDLVSAPKILLYCTEYRRPTTNLICIFCVFFENQEHCLHSCNFSHVKYFQMLPIQILPPLLFWTDFQGYKGLQYVHNFLVFWVISNFFKCQKRHYSRHGLPVNSHANFTYSFPTLKIILIPTMTRSNRFWFIMLNAQTGIPMPKSQFLYVT
jgi:hypothetical protein